MNDYKIHVFEISWLTDEQISMFTSDFRIVANFFVNKRKNENYIPDDPQVITHVNEVLKLLSVMTGDNRYETILRNEEGVYTMCDVAERLEKKGESRLADLIKILLAENRIDELGKVASDEEERKRLYKEYGIID